MTTDFRTLHEAGVLSDILHFIDNPSTNPGDSTGVIKDTFDGIKSIWKNEPKSGYTKDKLSKFVINSNIAKTASALTAVFPVIVSKAVAIEQAVMVSKAVERKCVTMLQMLFAANQITNVSTAFEYLGAFHKNISKSLDISGLDIDDVLKYTEGITEATYPAMVEKAIEQVNRDVKTNIHYTLESELKNPPISDMIVVNEAQYSNNQVTVKMTNTNDQTSRTMHYNDRGLLVDQLGPNEKGQGSITLNNKDSVEHKYGTITPQDIDKMNNVLTKQILPTDIKKANEAQPSMMIINFVHKDAGMEQTLTTAVIGVKAVIHYVDPQDIVNRVILKNSDNRGLFNFIRATTREISFFKDFLFSVNRAKVDAIAKSGKGSTDRVWKLLELRADHLKRAKATRVSEAEFAAITTLVITKEEVDYIKQFHRIDLAKAGTLRSIMRGYNMMCTAIIDNVSERVDFLWDDGSNQFESLSFMSLEREDTGSMYKKVLNLATRGR